jgi:hypothetical protein
MRFTCGYEKFVIKNPRHRVNIGRVGIKAAAKFDLNNSGEKATLKIRRGGQLIKDEEFAGRNGAWYELAFRNIRSPFHQHGHGAKSDFPLYYTVADTGGEEYDFDPKLDGKNRSEAPVLCGAVSGGRNLFT